MDGEVEVSWKEGAEVGEVVVVSCREGAVVDKVVVVV